MPKITYPYLQATKISIECNNTGIVPVCDNSQIPEVLYTVLAYYGLRIWYFFVFSHVPLSTRYSRYLYVLIQKLKIIMQDPTEKHFGDVGISWINIIIITIIAYHDFSVLV